jgi:hypothetical protein
MTDPGHRRPRHQSHDARCRFRGRHRWCRHCLFPSQHLLGRLRTIEASTYQIGSLNLLGVSGSCAFIKAAVEYTTAIYGVISGETYVYQSNAGKGYVAEKSDLTSLRMWWHRGVQSGQVWAQRRSNHQLASVQHGWTSRKAAPIGMASLWRFSTTSRSGPFPCKQMGCRCTRT